MKLLPITQNATETKGDPTDVLIALLKVRRVNISIHESHYLAKEGFFRPPRTQDFASHTHGVLRAVRDGNIEALEELRTQGTSLSCCSMVKESILHLACRKGKTDVVRYLVDVVGVPVNVVDDYGRTPMHDACWTRGSVPNIELVNILCSKCPDLLFIRDQKGYTPLQYAPTEHWRKWIKFFTKNSGKMKPKYLH